MNKTSKECTTCRHLEQLPFAYPCEECNVSPENGIEGFEKWEPIEEKPKPFIMIFDKIKFNRLMSLLTLLICASMAFWGDHNLKDLMLLLAINILWFYLGFISRRPHPDEKSFIIWLKICILKYKIFILKRKCAKYPDLRKYRGHLHIRAMINGWRLKLNDLKRELKKS